MKNIDILSLHDAVINIQSLLCLQNLPCIIADGSVWSTCGARDELIDFLYSLDTFCVRRNKKREGMQEKHDSTANRNKFSKKICSRH